MTLAVTRAPPQYDRWQPATTESFELASSLGSPAQADVDDTYAPPLFIFARWEAIYRLSYGVAGAWVDEQAAKRLQKVLLWGTGTPTRNGCVSPNVDVERQPFGGPPTRHGWKSSVRWMLRLSLEATQAHFEWRSTLLPRLSERAR